MPTTFEETTVTSKDVPSPASIAAAEWGMRLVQEGRLKELRETLGLSRTAMAALLYVSPITYRRWEAKPDELSDEDGGRRMWHKTAERVGRFYAQAAQQLDELREDGINIDELEPLLAAASRRGVGQEVLYHQYRNGQLEAYDLGVLGIWVDR